MAEYVLVSQRKAAVSVIIGAIPQSLFEVRQQVDTVSVFQTVLATSMVSTEQIGKSFHRVVLPIAIQTKGPE